MRQCPLGFLEVPTSPPQEPLCLLLSSQADEEALATPRTPDQQRQFCTDLGARPVTLQSTQHYLLLRDNLAQVFEEVS